MAVAKKKITEKKPRQSLLAVAKSVGEGKANCLLDFVDAETRADLIAIAKGLIDGTITGSRRRIAAAITEAGTPITRNHLDTIISRIKSGAVK